MLNFRKGQGNVIAWVLLVGFAVSLAVLVGRWSIQQSQKSVSSIVETGEGDIMCENVAISAVCECNGDCNLDVSNKGTLNIYQLNIGGCTTKDVGKGDNNWYIGLNEKKEITLSKCSDELITLIPMIKIEDRLIGCANKELNIDVDNC